jgi:adenylosuccinate synthase
MRAKAVIGANYGDEGKGRTVDWLAASFGSAALVVRSNGGAQAGHTVETVQGQRHVFHHIGSGTFAGGRTHLSQFAVSHPILFEEETSQLRRMGAAPMVSADPRGFVTTPWDMMVNQAVELARGGVRHGSCGLGFGETVGRCEGTGYALRIADLNAANLRDRLVAIRDVWLPQRAAELDLAVGQGSLAYAQDEDLLGHFIEQCGSFSNAVTLRDDARIGEEEAMVIFEGAQGLLLDQHAGGFPYVTRSNTGIANICAIMAEARMETLDVFYVSRCYLTRHGRGPMEDERPIEQWYKVNDPTNRPNPWQEQLRFGLLNPCPLGERIAADMADAKLDIRASLAITCLDQVRTQHGWTEDGQVVEASQENFLEAIARSAGIPTAVAFSSPVNELAALKMQKVFL